MFSEELEKIDWEETTKTIYSKTESDVLRALGKEHCDVDDFMALISLFLVRNAHERGNFHEMIAYGFAAAVKKNKTF